MTFQLAAMVVTRKIRGGKKDDPPASTSAEEPVSTDIISGDIVEAAGEAADDIAIELGADGSLKGPIEIKEEFETAEGAAGGSGREKRTTKPSFKVKYAQQKLPGRSHFGIFDGWVLEGWRFLNKLKRSLWFSRNVKIWHFIAFQAFTNI